MSSIGIHGGTHIIVDSLPAGGAGLTDAELRATPVPISGTVTASADFIVDRESTGTITSTQSVTINTKGGASLAIELTGTWTGQVNFEVSLSGTTFYPLNVTPIYPISAPINAASGNAVFTVPVGGYDSFRVRGATVTSGTVTVQLQLGAGANVVGTSGTLVQNSVAPTGGLIGVMPAVASAAAPTYGEGFEVLLSTTLSGDTRVTLDGETVPVTGTFFQATQPVSLAAVPALVAGSANIGDVDIASIAAGDNNIGNVDIVSLPALVAGSANIGDVDVASIAAGDNNIGNVDVVTLPALVAGSANIGDVDIASIATGQGKTLLFVPIAQGAAGTTQLVAADATKKIKVVNYVVVQTEAGTTKFTDGVGDLTGAMAFATNGGVVASGQTSSHWFETAANSALSIVTTVGAAQGHLSYFLEA